MIDLKPFIHFLMDITGIVFIISLNIGFILLIIYFVKEYRNKFK